MSARSDGDSRESPDDEDAKSKPFRFKGTKQQKDDEEDEASAPRKRRRHHHSSRHRSHRSKRSKSSHLADDPAQHPESMRHLGTDQAFRESLFDAMGDDEGATFWEGVYGQPIHKYPNTYLNEETGELEQMNDEEYAQFVRRKMWDKSREGIEAAQEERRRQKAEAKAREKMKPRDQDNNSRPSDGAHNNFVFDFEIEASLRRGQRRKNQKQWQELWKSYLQRWEELQTLAKNPNRPVGAENLFLRNKIAWPVESGKGKDVSTEEIERFIERGTETSQTGRESNRDVLIAALKAERVRWHPDKMHQRYGFMEIDEITLKGITATFQVFDRMWNEIRGTEKR